MLSTDMARVLLIGLLAYNTLVAAVFALDKGLARRGARRVSERTLLGLAACFGAPGALLAMRTVRHKTQKPRFRFGVPLLLLAQAAAVGVWVASS
jgi:uncharacterized membrane protein YsdA (DUF1294 family)